MATQVEERRFVRLRIPQFLEEFYYAFEAEDYEVMQELKTNFEKTWDLLTPRNRKAFAHSMGEFMRKQGLSVADLNNEFDWVFSA